MSFTSALVSSRCRCAVSLFALALLVPLASPTASAQGVYKWVDENGKVHYGDRPPAKSTSKSVEVAPATPSTGTAPTAAERAARQQQLLRAFAAERAERERARSEKKEALVEKKALRRKCARARDKVDRLRVASGVYDYDDQGNRQYLDEQQRAQLIERLNGEIARNCR